MDRVEVYRSRARNPLRAWHWRRVATNGRKLSRSSEGYRDESHAREMAVRCNSGGFTLVVNGEVSSQVTPPRDMPQVGWDQHATSTWLEELKDPEEPLSK